MFVRTKNWKKCQNWQQLLNLDINYEKKTLKKKKTGRTKQKLASFMQNRQHIFKNDKNYAKTDIKYEILAKTLEKLAATMAKLAENIQNWQQLW